MFSLYDDLQSLATDLTLEFIGASLGDDSTMVDHCDPVRQLIGLFQVLRSQKECDATIDERVDDRPHLLATARIKASRRFIEEKYFRTDDQCGSKIEAPSHTTRICLDRTSCRIAQ